MGDAAVAGERQHLFHRTRFHLNLLVRIPFEAMRTHRGFHYTGAGAPRITYGDVKITRSQPGTRAYGAAGEKAEADRKAKEAGHG